MRGKTAVSAATMLQPKAAKQQQQQQRQQQRSVLTDVKPHHEKLLQQLLGAAVVVDVSKVSRTPDITPASAINTMFALIFQMQATLDVANLAAAAAASSSSRSRSIYQRQQQQRPPPAKALPDFTHEPLLLTLLQLLQLVPDRRVAGAQLQLMQFTLRSLADLMLQSACPGQEVTGNAAVRAFRGGLPLNPLLFGWVQDMQPLLVQQLGPAVLHAIRVSKKAAAGDDKEDEDELPDVLVPNFWAGKMDEVFYGCSGLRRQLRLAVLGQQLCAGTESCKRCTADVLLM
jgi:hypothetical protein